MSWRLHHTNVTAYDVARSTEWYTNVIGLTPRPPSFETGHGKGRDIAWFEVEGSAQLGQTRRVGGRNIEVHALIGGLVELGPRHSADARVGRLEA